MGVELIQAFRPREGERGTDLAPESLGDLLSFREPRDAVGRAIRRAQMDAVVRLVPATVTAQLLAAGLVAVTMRPFVADLWLGLWFGAVLLLCILRGARAFRIRIDADYAVRRPAKLGTVVLVLAMLAALWLVPPIFWFSATDSEHQMMLGVLVIALMSAGSVSLASVPQASLTYLMILSTGGLVMTSKFDSRVHVALMLLFTIVLCLAAVVNARRFVSHVRTQIEMQEQSELISLLREFEASGSDWLWQLDRNLKLTYMSRAMAEAIGKPLSQLIGTHASRILDPDGNAVQLSAGMRRLMLHASDRTAFRDIAIPVDHGRRWWSISAKPLLDPGGRFQGWRGVGSDITDTRLSGSDSVRAARLDPLTGVANRLLLREQLEEALLRQLGGVIVAVDARGRRLEHAGRDCRGDEHPVAPDDRRRPAAAGHLDRPGDVLRLRPALRQQRGVGDSCPRRPAELRPLRRAAGEKRGAQERQQEDGAAAPPPIE